MHPFRPLSATAASLFCVLAAAPSRSADFTWDGGGDGVSWNDPLNWTADSGVPGAGDRAIFNTGASVQITDAITAAVQEADIQAGRVDLLNLANTLPATTLRVQAGAILGAIAANTASSLGAASVALAGGTLEFLPGASAQVNGMTETWFSSANDLDFADTLLDPLTLANPLSLLARTPLVSKSLNTALAFPDDASLSARSTLGADRIAALWRGRLNIGAAGSGAALTAGAVTFGTRSDDGSVVYIDLDGNGVFDSPGELIVNNKGLHGALNRVGTATLAEGSYAIAIGFYERTGGAVMEARFAPGTVVEANYGTMTVINPTLPAQNGMITFESVPSGAVANAVSVSASSAIRLTPSVPRVDLGALSCASGITLTLDTTTDLQEIGFSSTQLAGPLELNQTGGGGRLVLRNLTETGIATLTQNGGGTVVLPTANTLSGVVAVLGGTLEAGANAALGDTAAGTEVGPGGSLRLAGSVVYTATETLLLAGNGNARSDAALLGVSGTTDFHGPIFLGGAARIRSTSGTLRLFGRLDLAGQDLELRTDGNLEFQTGGITGAGSITQRGNATAIHYQNADAGTDFSASLRIFDGTWDARGVNSLGATAGNTVVENNGRLLLRDGRTWAEAIVINGTDGGTGAIRSENNNNTLTGPVTLASDAMIWVNEYQLTVNGPISGAFLLQKAGAGTLTLGQDNTMSHVDLQGGEIRMRTPGALGGTTALFIDSGETLELTDGVILSPGGALATLHINNGGLAGYNGANLLSLPIQVGYFGAVNFGGTGGLVVQSAFGNGNAPAGSNLGLLHYGFHNSTDALLDLHNNGGIMGGGNPATATGFYAKATLTAGPGGRGLDFDNDADFIGAGAIGQVDNYDNLFLGVLNVSNETAGVWQLRNAGDDDRGGLWLDLDQDGVFESSTPGLGSNRGEQLSWEDTGAKSVTLAAGQYLFAVTHHEFGGGSAIDVRFRSPLMAAEAVIRPLDPAQAGLWTLPGTTAPENAVVKRGGGIVTLAGANSFNKGTTILDGTLVAAAPLALGITNNPVRVEGTLGIAGGITLRTGPMTLVGPGAPGRVGTVENLAGENTLRPASLTVADDLAQEISFGASGGKLVVDAPALDLRMARLALTGNQDVDFMGPIVYTLAGPQTVPALRAYLFNGNTIRLPTDPGVTPLATKTLFTSAYFNEEIDFVNFWGAAILGLNNPAAPNDPNNFGVTVIGDLTIAGSGDASVKFRTLAADDANRIRVDLNRNGVFETGSEDPYAQDRGGDFTTATVTVPRGVPVPVALQQREGGGSSRLRAEVSLDDGATWQRFTPGGMTGATFTTAVTPRPDVVKRGAGVATLYGANTHAGRTIAEAGMLVGATATAFGDAAGETWADGGTLGLRGPMTIADETFRLRGGGVTNQLYSLVNLAGDTVLAPSCQVGAFTNTLGFALGAAAGRLIVQGPVTMNRAALTVDGPGEVALQGTLSGYGQSGAPPQPFAGTFTFSQIGAPTFNTEGWTVTSGFAGAHDRGGGNIAVTAGRSPGDYAWDNPHPTLVFSSPAFRLSGAGDLTWHMLGGDSNGRALPASLAAVLAQPNSSNATGVQGVGLRRVDTGAYVLTKAAPNDNFNGMLSFTAAELAALDQGLVYVFDFYDNYDGGWGWVDVDDVTIPGLRMDSTASDNRLTKKGSGTLRLDAANTYDGTTTVLDGILLANHPGGATGSSNLVVRAGGVLGGLGRVSGAITVETRGVIEPGASPGALSAGSSVTFANYSSVFRAELNGAGLAGADYDHLAATGALALNGATLDLRKGPGYSPSAGQTLVLATAGGIAGTFQGLPEGARVSAQGAEFVISYTNLQVRLTATGGRHVYAGPDTVYRLPGAPVTLPLRNLLDNDLPGDGVAGLSVVSVSPTSIDGGALAVNGDLLTYTPASAYTGDDSFTYTVSDGTDTAVGLVTVRSGARSGARPFGYPAGLAALPGGGNRVTFTGTPGATYAIEYTLDIRSPVTWIPLGSAVADPAGLITFDHASPPANRVYYRCALP